MRVPFVRSLLAATTTALALSAHAAPEFLLDEFDDPAPARSTTLDSTKPIDLLRDLTASVPGGVRDAVYSLDVNPSGSTAQFSVGGGTLSAIGGAGVIGQGLALYGTLTHAGGPLVEGPQLGLDFSAFDRARLTFESVLKPVTIEIGLFTNTALSQGVFFSNTILTVTPTTPGGPMIVDVPFAADPLFNFAQVDGITVIVDRNGVSAENAWALDRVVFTTAVPEPASIAMMLAGLALVGGASARSRSKAPAAAGAA